MTSFLFRTTPEIVARPGATGDLGAILKARGATRVAFVTDRGVVAAGLTEVARASLRAEGLGEILIDDVVADPPEALVRASIARARAEGADAVASVGGGSSLDTAKLVALGLGSDQPLAEMYGVDQARGERVPLALAPTTAGTGSEVTPIAIVTTGAAEKKGVVARQLYPDAALLDAELTLGLPRAATAATGIDAMVHAIEAYTSARLKNPLSDLLAQEALRRLGANIRRVCDAPEDVAARGEMLFGSMLAGMAFANAPVAAVHALAYPLGGHFKVAHGLSNCLVLPHVLAFNAPAAARLYADLAPLVFDGADRAPDALIAGFERLAPEIGLPTRLREVGVGESDLDLLAGDAMKQTRLLMNNPREMTLDAARAIYDAAF